MKHKLTFLLLAAGMLSSLQAGETMTASGKGVDVAVQPAADTRSIYDKIWGLTTLYKNDSNPIIQEFGFVGRAQFDWFYFDADQGQADDWVVRRIRVGGKAKVFKNFTIHSEVDLNLQDPNPVYNKLTDAYVKWSPYKEFNLTVGKHGTKFTLDGATSSTQLIAIDRSQIANNFWFPEEYIPGVSVSGEVGNWVYNVGYYSSGEATKEFGDFNAGSFGLVSFGYNFADALKADKALLRLDYVYQDENPGNTFTRSHQQIGSLNFNYEKGRYGLGTDLVAAQGYGKQSDLFGLEIMPSVYVANGLQFVLRYTYIDSDGDNGIRLARYENRIVSGRGDNYNEFYAGLNWYLYGHKLKLQTGVQYAMMDDSANDGGEYQGWGVTTGLRISW